MSEAKVKTIIGTVVSDKMTKTIRVEVTGKKRHAKYMKYIPTRSTFFAHDEENSAKEGDVVQISFTRPQSKRKRWKLDKIITVAN